MRHWTKQHLVIGLLVSVAAVLAPSAGAPAAAVSTPTTSVTSAPLGSRLVVNTLLENTVVLVTNIKRAAAGCGPLKVNRDLRTAARKHSYQMARHQQMSHQLPGEPRLGRRVTLAGYTNWRIVAENVAAGFSSARLVVRAWWNSTAHRRNITNCALREVGIGVVVYGGRLWWTQDFGRR